jgi:hypothetical protein
MKFRFLCSPENYGGIVVYCTVLDGWSRAIYQLKEFFE